MIDNVNKYESTYCIFLLKDRVIINWSVTNKAILQVMCDLNLYEIKNYTLSDVEQRLVSSYRKYFNEVFTDTKPNGNKFETFDSID
jgi:hypothetical protein